MAIFRGAAGDDSLAGSAVNDFIDGLEGADTLVGLDGEDRLVGHGGLDRLWGGGGNDTLIGVSGADTLDGGDGADTAWYERSPARIVISLESGLAIGGDAERDVLRHVENIVGSRFDDFVAAHAGANVLYGLAGNDVLDGLAGDDRLYGGDGDDWLAGGAGADRLAGGAGNDTYSEVDALDMIVELVDGGRDTISTHLLDYRLPWLVEDLTLLASSGGARGVGNDLDNRVTGGPAADTLVGGKGADTLLGLSGNDVLDGGTGADLMVGGGGSDTYHVGHGDRIYEETPYHGHDHVFSSVSIVLPERFEEVTLVGDSAIRADGNTGDNRLNGNALGNKLQGGQGHDILNGMAGDDTLVGGNGRDTLSGGDGDDTFKFVYLKDSFTWNEDLITDFSPGDRLDLSVMDANTRATGDQAFTHAQAYTGRAGQLVLTYDATTDRTQVVADMNGDRITDFSVSIVGQHTSVVGWVM